MTAEVSIKQWSVPRRSDYYISEPPRQDDPRDSPVAFELVDDEQGSGAVGIGDRGDLIVGLCSSWSHKFVSESLREDEPRNSQAARGAVDDEDGSVAADIDDRGAYDLVHCVRPSLTIPFRVDEGR